MNFTLNSTVELSMPNKLAIYLDYTTRIYACTVHIIYFLFLILKSKSELRTRACLFLNNMNIATFLISLLYVAYIPARTPSFADATFNALVCTASELAWSCLKYARVLSLLLLATYRYIACLNVALYKQLNSKLIYLVQLVFLCWLISTIVPVTFKVALNTTHSTYYCTDGYAPDRILHSIFYYVTNTLLGSVLPTLIIIAMYVRIYRKLKKQAIKTGTSSNKLARFARQFIVINVLTALSTVFATFVDFVNVIAVS